MFRHWTYTGQVQSVPCDCSNFKRVFVTGVVVVRCCSHMHNSQIHPRIRPLRASGYLWCALLLYRYVPYSLLTPFNFGPPLILVRGGQN